MIVEIDRGLFALVDPAVQLVGALRLGKGLCMSGFPPTICLLCVSLSVTVR